MATGSGVPTVTTDYGGTCAAHWRSARGLPAVRISTPVSVMLQGPQGVSGVVMEKGRVTVKKGRLTGGSPRTARCACRRW